VSPALVPRIAQAGGRPSGARLDDVGHLQVLPSLDTGIEGRRERRTQLGDLSCDAHRDLTTLDRITQGLVGQQAQPITHVLGRHVDHRGHGRRCLSAEIDQFLIGARFIEGCEIMAMEVLGQLDDPQSLAFLLTDNCWNLRETGTLGGHATASSRNNHVLRRSIGARGNRAHQKRLQDAKLRDAGGEFCQTLISSIMAPVPPGLSRIRHDLREGNEDDASPAPLRHTPSFLLTIALACMLALLSHACVHRCAVLPQHTINQPSSEGVASPHRSLQHPKEALMQLDALGLDNTPSPIDNLRYKAL
jgi:hypothetical protein